MNTKIYFNGLLQQVDTDKTGSWERSYLTQGQLNIGGTSKG